MIQLFSYKVSIFLKLLLLSSFTSISIVSLAQIQSKNVNTMQLSVEDGLTMSRADDIVCDEQNILWIKSARGLQYWDGQNIHTFKDSLLNVGTEFFIYPHSKEGIIVSMAGLARHFTFENHSIKIIYKSQIESDNFIPIPLSTERSTVLLIHPDSLFYSIENGISTTQFIEQQSLEEFSSAGFYRFSGKEHIVDLYSKRAFLINSMLPKTAVSKLFVNRIRFNHCIDSENYIYSGTEGLSFIDNSSETLIRYPKNLKARYYSTILKISNETLLVGIDNMLYEYDLAHDRWTTVYKNIDQNNLLQTGYFDNLIFDKYNNIWAITVNEGLLKIYNNESFQYIGSVDKKLNFVKNIVVDEADNRIITSGLNGGILVFDTLGNQTIHMNSDNTNGLVGSVTGVYKIGPNQYIYNNHRDSIIYGLSFDQNKGQITKLGIKEESYVYYQDAIQIYDRMSLLLFNTLYTLHHSSFKLTPLFQYNATKSCIIKDGQYAWIGCIDGILKYRIGSDKDYEFIKLPGEGYIRSISKWKDNTLALGTDKGLSIFDKNESKLRPISEGCIYCLLTDEEDNIWAGTGTGLIKFDSSLNEVHYSSIDGLQNNEFNTNACVKSSSGKMYFGGLNGITSFDPKNVTNKDHKTSFYIKNLAEGNTSLVTNSLIENVGKFTLEHDHNNLKISVGANGKFESSDYNYQYYVDGLSSQWVDAKNQTSYNFNLSPGGYNFYFVASNAFDPNAKLENPLVVTISNPWWKQWWFYLLLILLATGIIAYLIRTNEKQKYLKKKFEWELEYQRQEDRIKMSKELHDNIGSRLTFLVSSIENIKKAFRADISGAEKKIDHITDFGKDTIEDLRSMMWVLSQKNITLQDLQLKILDFLNIAKNTYSNIDIQYDGPTSNLDQKLDSKLSQNIFRVIQEGIHNSIKHANPSVISIRLSYDSNRIKVSIKDDGDGFKVHVPKNGNGLSNMKSRLAEHNSEIIISSNIGKGTTLEFEVESSQ